MPKRIPVRQCVACRRKRDKPDLARVVRLPDGSVTVDFRGKVSGRGAYICKDISCLEKAVKSRALTRTLGVEIPDEALTTLRESFLRQKGEEGEHGEQTIP